MITYSAMQKYLHNPRVGACSQSTDCANISIRRLAAARCSKAESSWHGVCHRKSLAFSRSEMSKAESSWHGVCHRKSLAFTHSEISEAQSSCQQFNKRGYLK